MVRIILLSHESLADAMKLAVESICGPQPDLEAYGITAETDFERLVKELSSAVAYRTSSDRGILIMTDLLGGSTTQLAARLLVHEKVAVVTGLNLPMLIGVIGKRHDLELESLTEFAVTNGRSGIDDLAALLEAKATTKQEEPRN